MRRRVFRILQSWPLKTQLLSMMASLLVLSLGSLFLLHLLGERQLLSQVQDYTEGLSTAIEIAQEQPGVETNLQKAVQAYAEKLRQLGVKDVSIANELDEVQASTNPRNVGKRLRRKTSGGRREYVIRGVLGEESGPPGSQQTSTLTVPIIVSDRRVGNVLITRILDDFSVLSKTALLSRILATLAVFALGILLSLYLSWSVSRPLNALTEAARQVAAGNLDARVPESDVGEIGNLSRTFNGMVERLKENHALEERLHFAERSTALGRLASAVAHEIGNPLNFINLSLDHVRSRLAPQEPERREAFERVMTDTKAEISRLNRLIRDFLAFGKPIRLDPRLCAVDTLLREVGALVEHKAKDHGIELSLDIEDELPRVFVDPELLKTCLLNLMINAVDAMPQGGTLRCAIKTARHDAQDALEITVQDAGSGMTEEEMRNAFEPYFSTKEAGLGLGLALTRKIIEDHRGTITLASARGRGTTARIVLPLGDRQRDLPQNTA